MDAANNIEITVECLCKKHTFSTDIPKSSLPLGCTVCHCSSCRHATGALYVIGTTWPSPRDKVNTEGLQRYQFSENLTYLFCGTCSTMVFFEKRDQPEKIGVFSGPLRNIDANLLKLRKHIYVEDTVDGGASVWLRKPNPDNVEIPRYLQRSGEIPWTWPDEAEPQTDQEQDSIAISCHCKGVNLRLHPGNFAAQGRDQIPWFIDPRNNKRLASFDACDSCRLHFANEIVHWTFTSLSHISTANGGAYPRNMKDLKAAADAGDSAVGTLACYQSSVDAHRYFCRVCSAAVFYACEDRPEIVDVAIGLLEGRGARAEEVLSWTFGEEPVWVDDVKGGWRDGLMKRVRRDAEEFRIGRGYEKSWRRLARESKD